MAYVKKKDKSELSNSLISTIRASLQTPVFEVKFSNLVKPFHYSNSPAIPRYSVSCVIDREIHKDFIFEIMEIEKSQNAATILKNEKVSDGEEAVPTGKLVLKFQDRQKIPVFLINEKKEKIAINLDEEFSAGEKISILCDVNRYTKKNTFPTEYGISIKPKEIFYFPEPVK